MKIQDLNRTRFEGVTRVEATVNWEDSDRPPIRLFFESAGGKDHFWPDPNAFLVACLLPAWSAGERRISLCGEICPVLYRGLQIAVALLRSWYPDLSAKPPVIEPALGLGTIDPVAGQSLSLLSCGVDSMATLRWNRLNLPDDHPEAIRAVVAMSSHGVVHDSPDEVERHPERLFDRVRLVARAAEVEAICVVTNVLELANGYVYTWKWHGAVLSSIAALFSNRFRKAFLGGAFQAPDLHPWGSHPLIDPHYSSAHFSIAHDGFESSRLDKINLVAEWDAGLSNLIVCQKDNAGPTNCGACEKCIRTMLALVSIGKLQDCGTFPLDDLDAALIWTLDEYDMINKWGNVHFYEQLLTGLEGRGRHDLATAVRGVLEAAASRVGGP